MTLRFSRGYHFVSKGLFTFVINIHYDRDVIFHSDLASGFQNLLTCCKKP